MLRNRCSLESPARRQAGFVLITALILLLILTLLGLAATESTSLQEKMAGNTRSANLAFQSAEAGLIAAQGGILQGLWDNANYASNASGTYLLETCCAPAIGWTSAWTVPGVWGSAIAASTTTSGLTLAHLAAQPVFIVEELPAVAPPGANLGAAAYGAGTPPTQPYRLTALGTGGDQTTQVLLQAVVTQ